MRTGTIESAGRRVVGAPPSLHVECLEAHGAMASASNMKTIATRHRTSTPSIPPVAVVPVASSVQWFNVTITSTATRPADGSAIARPRVDAIPRVGKGLICVPSALYDDSNNVSAPALRCPAPALESHSHSSPTAAAAASAAALASPLSVCAACTVGNLCSLAGGKTRLTCCFSPPSS